MLVPILFYSVHIESAMISAGYRASMFICTERCGATNILCTFLVHQLLCHTAYVSNVTLQY